MKIILTGATGFLGSHLAQALVMDGHQVIAIKRRSSGLQRLVAVQSELVFYDAEGLDFTKPFTEQGTIDAVIHTATCYARQGESTTDLIETNLLFPLRLLEAATCFDTKTFFNTDTYFNTDTIICKYMNGYALSKRQFMEWGRQCSEDGKIRFVNIRLQHLYGPGDDESKFTTHVINNCMANVPEFKLTPGEQRRDFIYIEDAVAAYLMLIHKAGYLGTGFQPVGLGSGYSMTVREFVETVHRLTQSKTQLEFGALLYREHEIMESTADITRLVSLGWHCQTNLQEGIKQMIREYGK